MQPSWPSLPFLGGSDFGVIPGLDASGLRMPVLPAPKSADQGSARETPLGTLQGTERQFIFRYNFFDFLLL